GGTGKTGRRTILAEDGAQAPRPFAGGGAGAGAGDRGRHDVAPLARRTLELGERCRDRALLAPGPPFGESRHLLGLGIAVGDEEAGGLARKERRGLALGEAVDA